MGTTWGPSGGYGDDVGIMGTMWGQCGDDMGTTGMTWGTMGMMQGPQGPHGDNEITKNAITFEQIKIIEFCLKIWDP